MPIFNPTKEFYELLILVYDHFNRSLFNDELIRPLVTVTRQKNVFGYYSPERWKKKNNDLADEIAINPMMFAKFPLTEICQTIVHEMCHQWQFSHGSPSRPGYHNSEWGDKMMEIGLMPSHNGKEGGNKTGQRMADYLIADGKFDLATKELLNNDTLAVLYYDVTNEVETNIAELETEIELILTETQITQVDNPEFMSESHSTTINALSAKEKKQKIKYTCSICDINVWGKPELYLICGSCKSRFEEVTPNKTF